MDYHLPMNEFIQHILQTLKNNGFPGKRVSLPTDKMFEVADSKGFSFNDVLAKLKTEQNIDSQIGPEKIVFTQSVQAAPANKDDMMKQAQEMMAKMTPEELKKIQDMFENMTPEQKEEIMKKGKDMGLI